MKTICSDVKDFYFYYHTTVELKRENPKEWVIKTSPCSRLDFASGTADALAFLVYNVALSIFSAIGVIATIGLASCFKASFRKNAYEGIVHAATIPVSIAGFLFPKTINNNFLKLKPIEFKHPADPHMSAILRLLGDVVLRHRQGSYL